MELKIVWFLVIASCLVLGFVNAQESKVSDVPSPIEGKFEDDTIEGSDNAVIEEELDLIEQSVISQLEPIITQSDNKDEEQISENGGPSSIDQEEKINVSSGGVYSAEELDAMLPGMISFDNIEKTNLNTSTNQKTTSIEITTPETTTISSTTVEESSQSSTTEFPLRTAVNEETLFEAPKETTDLETEVKIDANSFDNNEETNLNTSSNQETTSREITSQETTIVSSTTVPESSQSPTTEFPLGAAVNEEPVSHQTLNTLFEAPKETADLETEVKIGANSFDNNEETNLNTRTNQETTSREITTQETTIVSSTTVPESSQNPTTEFSLRAAVNEEPVSHQTLNTLVEAPKETTDLETEVKIDANPFVNYEETNINTSTNQETTIKSSTTVPESSQSPTTEFSLRAAVNEEPVSHQILNTLVEALNETADLETEVKIDANSFDNNEETNLNTRTNQETTSREITTQETTIVSSTTVPESSQSPTTEFPLGAAVNEEPVSHQTLNTLFEAPKETADLETEVKIGANSFDNNEETNLNTSTNQETTSREITTQETTIASSTTVPESSQNPTTEFSLRAAVNEEPVSHQTLNTLVEAPKETTDLETEVKIDANSFVNYEETNINTSTNQETTIKSSTTVPESSQSPTTEFSLRAAVNEEPVSHQTLNTLVEAPKDTTDLETEVKIDTNSFVNYEETIINTSTNQETTIKSSTTVPESSQSPTTEFSLRAAVNEEPISHKTLNTLVEAPKDDLETEVKIGAKTAETTKSGGGVDKSVIGIVIAAMIVVVAVIAITKNWRSIKNKFSSTPRPNERTPTTNGTTPEEVPLQEKSNDKSPV